MSALGGWWTASPAPHGHRAVASCPTSRSRPGSASARSAASTPDPAAAPRDHPWRPSLATTRTSEPWPCLERPLRSRAMLSDGRRLGAHLPLGAGMVRAVERAHEIGAEALQVFCDNPTAWRRRPTLPKELPRFRERLGELDIRPLAIHAAYLVNLAGDEPTFHAQSIELLTSDLRDRHRVRCVVRERAHRVPSWGRRGGGREGVGDGRRRRAGASATPARASPDSSSRIPPGADSAWASRRRAGGDRPRRSSSAAWTRRGSATAWTRRTLGRRARPPSRGTSRRSSTLRRPDRARPAGDGPPQRLASELGSRLDRHEHLGAGRIGARGLRGVLTTPPSAHVAYFLETPGMDEGYDAINVARAYDLAAGRPLADLPPEAIELRGTGRGRGPAEPSPTGRAAVTLADARVDGDRRDATWRCLLGLVVLAAAAAPPGPRDARARGTRTRATTCSCCAPSCGTGSCPLLGPPTSIGDVPPRRPLLLPAGPGRAG